MIINTNKTELIMEINKIIKFRHGSDHELPEATKKSLVWLNKELEYLKNMDQTKS